MQAARPSSWAWKAAWGVAAGAAAYWFWKEPKRDSAALAHASGIGEAEHRQRLLMGSLGLGLAGLGLVQRGPVATGTTALGFGLMARSVAQRNPTSSAGTAGTERAPSLRHVVRTVELPAPIAYVYSIWEALEHLPKFMKHVREVTRTGEDRYHWKVDGPGGIPIEWDALVTAKERERLIAWQTVPGSRLVHEGRVEFEATGASSTRISVHFAYHPPGGALGHAIAKLLGSDPESEMDDDLARLQGLVGKSSR